ncbi:VOC family protein [Nitratireductor alexandrii]|uniref:VOC family protein n=1 Tax=Nitratireductor alexandrii TaxID=2448161 RepID=UPI000FDBFA93|nr:VOC family protein [Nitratireductor alexandrii]
MPDHPDRLEALPVLPSLDLDETQRFYGGELGFTATVYREHDYLILRRDEVELHFWLTDDRSLCERSSVYIRGGAIGRWHADYRRRGVKNLSDLAVRAWNMEEFYIHDPHGNLLRFGRVPQAAAD